MRTTIGFLLLALCAACYPAFGSTNDDDRNTWSAGVELGALDNCNNVAINAAVTCGGTRGFRVEGYQWLTLEIAYTKDAGTGYTFVVQSCSEGQAATDCTDATDWGVVAAESVAGGVTNLLLGSFSHTAAASDHLFDTIGINYRRVRLADFVAGGSPTINDKIIVRGRLTVNGGF